jgi:hypothetical protein
MTTQPPSKGKSVIRPVALPAEHGGWGFVLEPIFLGLLIAPSWAGFSFALSALGMFLLHQPLKIALKGRFKGRRSQRTMWAERFTLGYGTIIALTFGLVLLTADWQFLLPLLMAVPMMSVLLGYDIKNKSRDLTAELLGASALGAIAPAIVTLGGFELGEAMVLWLLLLARTIPSILYIRARLRLERSTEFAIPPVWIVHLLTIVGIAALVLADVVPWMALVAVSILFGRMALGLSSYRKPRPVKVIGFQELGYGFLTVILLAMGYTWLA